MKYASILFATALLTLLATACPETETVTVGPVDTTPVCAEATDCASATASFCDTTLEEPACVACSEDAHCAGIEGKGICNAGECVQCTEEKREACGTNADDEAIVCIPQTSTCGSAEQTLATANVCEPCVTSQQCKPGRLCANLPFGDDDTETGTFCFWREDATETGGPAGACLDASKPFVSALELRSTEGINARLCTPALTTCQGLDDFRLKPCAQDDTDPDTIGPENHAQCGVPDLSDAFCALVDADAAKLKYQCTTPCGGTSDVDCEDGFECEPNDLIGKRVCSFGS